MRICVLLNEKQNFFIFIIKICTKYIFLKLTRSHNHDTYHNTIGYPRIGKQHSIHHPLRFKGFEKSTHSQNRIHTNNQTASLIASPECILVHRATRLLNSHCTLFVYNGIVLQPRVNRTDKFTHIPIGFAPARAHTHTNCTRKRLGQDALCIWCMWTLCDQLLALGRSIVRSRVHLSRLQRGPRGRRRRGSGSLTNWHPSSGGIRRLGTIAISYVALLCFLWASPFSEMCLVLMVLKCFGGRKNLDFFLC